MAGKIQFMHSSLTGNVKQTAVQLCMIGMITGMRHNHLIEFKAFGHMGRGDNNTITGDPEVEVITSLDQTLNYVEIEPYFYVDYNPNGGTGEMPDEGPYTSGTSIVLMDSGSAKEGY